MGWDSSQSWTFAQCLLDWFLQLLSGSPGTGVPAAGGQAPPRDLLLSNDSVSPASLLFSSSLQGNVLTLKHNNHAAQFHSPVGRQGIFLELPERTVREAWGGRVDASWSFLWRGGGGGWVGGALSERQLFLSSLPPAPVFILTNENSANCLLRGCACHQLTQKALRAEPCPLPHSL